MSYLISYEDTPMYFVERNYEPFPGETQDKYNLRTAGLLEEYKRDRNTKGRYYLIGKISELKENYEFARILKVMGLWEYEYRKSVNQEIIIAELKEYYQQLKNWMIDRYYNNDADPNTTQERNRLTRLVNNWLFNPPAENEKPHCPICLSDYIFNNRNHPHSMCYICQPTGVWDWTENKLKYAYGFVENGGVLTSCTLCPKQIKQGNTDEKK